MRLPTIRWTCGTAPGPWARAASTSRPTRYGRRPAAVRKSVSPSGMCGRYARLASAADGQAAIAGAEPGGEELVAKRGFPDRQAVDLADDELAGAAGGDERAQRPHRGRGDGRVVGRGEGLERGAAAFEVQGGHPVHQHDIRAGRPLERTPVRLPAAW